MQNCSRTVPTGRRCNQRGSALLVVLVLAAIVAIMLYRELPIAAFEAQRQKEQLAISRGNEYKRGVKLFVRKIGRFPTTLDELGNTNRMRFLRRRYVDPLTGKDDWRIVHAGPGGIIIDSKVQNSATQNKSANATGQGAVFAGFNNTFTGDQTALADAAAAAAPSAALRQRAPATKNAATAAGDGSNLPPVSLEATAEAANDPNGVEPAGPLQPGQEQPGQGAGGQGQTGAFNSQPPFDPVTGQANLNNGSGGNEPPGNLPGQNTAQQTGPPGPHGFGNSRGPDSSAAVGNGISSVAQQLNNVNQRTPEQSPGQTTSAFGNNTNAVGPQATQGGPGNGQIGAAGGIAGVASIAKGKSIKTVEEQTKYSLWEFYYDMKKEQNAAAAAAAGGLQQNGNNGANTNGGINIGIGNNTSGIGNNTSGIGNSNGAGQNSGGGFGQAQSQSIFGSSNTQQQQAPAGSGSQAAPQQ